MLASKKGYGEDFALNRILKRGDIIGLCALSSFMYLCCANPELPALLVRCEWHCRPHQKR